MSPAGQTPSLDRREFARRLLQWAVLLALPSPALSVDEMPEQGPFDVLVLRDRRARMRDGVYLATDVYLPARGADRIAVRVPTLLERTPYGKSQVGTRHASTA